MTIGNRAEWEKIMPKDMGKEDCPFCCIPEDDKVLILYETKYWTIRYNKYPYLGLKNHILTIPKAHKTITGELSGEELLDYKNVEIFIKNYFKDKEYFSFIRQSMKGRSLEHLHHHYLPGFISSQDIEYILEKNKY